jgi:hypothetical protein
MPTATASPPTTGGSGIVFFLSTEAFSGPRSMTFSRVV